MVYSKSGADLTKSFESCRYIAYFDDLGKVWTIAWGHTRGVTQGLTCIPAQAEAWLAEDYGAAESAVNLLVVTAILLTQEQFDALVDFTFNVGVENFAHSTMLMLLRNNNFTMAALEFDKWDHAGGQVVAGLLRRREAERQEFLSGDNLHLPG